MGEGLSEPAHTAVPVSHHVICVGSRAYLVVPYDRYNYYFDKSSLHWYWPFVHRPCFDQLYQHNMQKNVPLDLEFLTLTAIVMALALQFLPETDDDVSD